MGSSGHPWIAGCFAVALAAAAPVRAEAPGYVFQSNDLYPTTFGAVSVKVEASVGGPQAGMAWARSYVHNGSERSRRIAIAYAEPTLQVRRVLELAPGEQRAVLFPLPAGLDSGRIEIAVDGYPPQSVGFYVGRYMERRVVSVGNEEDFRQLVGRAQANTETSTPEPFSMRVMTVTPEHLPVELTAYAGVDEVVLAQPLLESLDESRRRALEGYAATGGRLVLSHCSASTRKHLPMFASAPKPGLNPYGFGNVFWCGGDRERLQEVFYNPMPRIADSPRHGTTVQSTEFPLLLPGAVAPVGRYYIIMVLFGVLVGPGSWWVARRFGSPLLLATIPGTSLLTCAVIIGSALVGSGLSTQVSALSLTLLDNAGGRAVTVGMGGFFSGTTPPALAIPNNASWSMQPASLSLDPTLVMERGFIPPRTYVEWPMSAVTPTRARLTVKDADGKVNVANSLGGRAKEIWIKRHGKLWMVRNLSDGAAAAAHAASGFAPPMMVHLGQVYRNVAFAPLQEGEFLASLSGTGFLPLGNLPIEDHDSIQVMRGQVQP